MDRAQRRRFPGIGTGIGTVLEEFTALVRRANARAMNDIEPILPYRTAPPMHSMYSMNDRILEGPTCRT